MFINISSDQISLSDGERSQQLARNGVENILGPLLVQRQKETPFHEVFLLNGPGGFTNLRIGTLMLNTRNLIGEPKLQIYDIDKLTLYAYLVHEGLLPSKGIIYLGQKHNVWLVDFEKDPSDPAYCATIHQSQFPEGEYFLDEVYDGEYWQAGKKRMVYFTQEKDQLIASYQGKVHTLTPEALQLTPVQHVEAKYMIEPVMN